MRRFSCKALVVGFGPLQELIKIRTLKEKGPAHIVISDVECGAKSYIKNDC